jgi:hypothetical protein
VSIHLLLGSSLRMYESRPATCIYQTLCGLRWPRASRSVAAFSSYFHVMLQIWSRPTGVPSHPLVTLLYLPLPYKCSPRYMICTSLPYLICGAICHVFTARCLSALPWSYTMGFSSIIFLLSQYQVHLLTRWMCAVRSSFFFLRHQTTFGAHFPSFDECTIIRWWRTVMHV